MPTTESDIERKAETSIINWLMLDATLAGIGVNNADETEVIALPSIYVHAQMDEETFPGTGVFKLTASVGLRVQADSQDDAALSLYWGLIHDRLNWDVLADRLSDLSNFHVYGVLRDRPPTHERGERSWLKEQPITLHCMAMDG